MFDAFLRWFYINLVRFVYFTLMPTTIIGKENMPDPSEGPFLVVGNHFSYFEPPLIGIHFFNKKIRFFVSPDTLGDYAIIDSLYRVYDDQLIYVNRGAVDRKALHAGLNTLRAGNWLIIFPEGGVTAEAINLATRGASTTHMQGADFYTRKSGQLLRPRPGTAMLATQTEAKILPIGIWGTEKVEDNLRRWRRTRLTMHIGKPLPPMTMPEGVRGRERRAYMDQVGDEIMQAIADLIPEENRGPYR